MRVPSSVTLLGLTSLLALTTGCQVVPVQALSEDPLPPSAGQESSPPAMTPESDRLLSMQPTPTLAIVAFGDSEILAPLEWEPPPYRAPLALRAADHFYFTKPIPSGQGGFVNPEYRYGSTHFGEECIHTGIDIVAARGTLVVAAAAGEVVWAGYGLYSGYEDKEDPYGLAVAVRHDFGYAGQVLYTVYGHLSSISVWPSQRVEMGQAIGEVGDTGHASGTHLHFEVRLDQLRYFSSRNPELWIVPAQDTGVVAGLALDRWGRPLVEQLIQLRSLDTGQRWQTWTYASGTVRPDEVYGENFAIGDLPGGAYEVRIDIQGSRSTGGMFLHPGQTNFLYFRHKQNYVIEPTTIPSESDTPPWP